MCQENRVLELGRITVSRRILAELTADKINEQLSYHQQGYFMTSNGEWVQHFPDTLVEILVNFYCVDNKNIVISTLLNDENKWETELCFADESDDRGRGYFDWALYQSRKSPLTLGDVLCSSGVKEALSSSDIHYLIHKQLAYDWGIVRPKNWALNDLAVENGERIVSQHYIADEYVYMITEAERSTTIMLEDEYLQN